MFMVARMAHGPPNFLEFHMSERAFSGCTVFCAKVKDRPEMSSTGRVGR